MLDHYVYKNALSNEVKEHRTESTQQSTVDFQLDSTNDRFILQGEPIRLTPKAFAVLRCLLEARGQLVRKEALLETVWPDVIVGDAALQVCIREIRKALNDSPTQPRFIQTIHRKGYRFIADSASPPALPPLRHQQQNSVLERTEIMQQLQVGLERALQANRQVLFLTGEAGIGKTTTVREFCKSIPGNILIAQGQCVDHSGSAEPFLPVLDALGKLCRGPQQKTIVALLQQFAPMWLLQMPSLVTAETYQLLHSKTAGQSPQRMLREMAEALEAMTQQFPLLLVLEDLHWSDHSTLDLLDFICRRQEPVRLLLIATYRPVDLILNEHPLKQLSQSLTARGFGRQLMMELLDAEEIQDFIALRYPGLQLEPDQLKVLYEKTYGNPLFLEIFLAHLHNLSVLQHTENQWRLLGDLSSIAMPNNLRVMINQQLQLLDKTDNHLLQIMSVVGMRANSPVMAAATGLSCDEVEQRCDRIVQQQLFIEFDGIEDLPDGAVAVFYQFQHTLYREVLYQQLAVSRQMRAHLVIARCLESQYQSRAQEHAVALAIHFSYGRDYLKAVYYWHLAAEQAVQRYAYSKAIEYIRHGLNLLPRIQDVTQRHQREVALQMTLGPVLIANEGNISDNVERTYLRAHELCELLQDDERAFPVLFGLRSYYQFRDQLHIAHQYSQKLLNLAQRTHNEDFFLESVVPSLADGRW